MGCPKLNYIILQQKCIQNAKDTAHVTDLRFIHFRLQMPETEIQFLSPREYSYSLLIFSLKSHFKT